MPQARILNPNAKFASNAANGGALTQVSRLGNPLVNELVIGLKDKDTFSTSAPKDDGQFIDYVTHPSLPELLNILFKDAVNTTLGANLETLAPTNFPRNDLVTAFLTGFPGVNQLATVTGAEMLRLNTAIAAKAQGNYQTILNTLPTLVTDKQNLEDALLLRLAIAEQSYNEHSGNQWQTLMAQRVALRELRQDRFHASDLAHYYLDINKQPEKALYWAEINWQQAKLDADQQLLTRAQGASL